MIDQCGYTQSVTDPTHARGNTLDLIITPSSSNIVASKPRTTILFSDHFAVECNLNLRSPRPPTRNISYRKLCNIDKDSFSTDLITNLCSCDTISDFNSNVLSVLDTHAPQHTRTVTDRINQPWYNREITVARRDLRKRERQDCKDFIIFRNNYRNLLHRTKREFYQRSIQTIADSKNNSKALYNITNTLIGKVRKSVLPSCTSDVKLCEEFRSFFATKVQQIHTKIKKSNPRSLSPTLSSCQHAYLNSFPIVTVPDTVVLIKAMKPKSCVLDPIPASIFKEYATQIAPAVRAIVNTSICSGTVPVELKESIITPIYKKKQLPINELSSYRPVAQMPFIAKLLERHVSKHLRIFLENNNINDLFQSAYRPNHSTETAVVKIFSDICLSLSQRRDVVLCLLDLSSAFDTLHHGILIQRLAEIGIRDKALEWFRSYLEGRTTSVKVNNSRSSPDVMKYGVPQGSVLGPTLFNVYSRPLGDVMLKYGISYHMYADDSQLYIDFSSCDEETAMANLQLCIQEIKTWLRDNFLLLNEKKTEVVKFGREFTGNHLQIGEASICSSSSATSLGCTLDSSLNMSLHASRVCKSANYYLHCIRKIRNFLTLDACKLLVHSLVTIRLDYCNAVFCGARNDVIRQLERVQRRAARVVCRKYNDHSSVTELMWGLHWLPIRARIQYKLLLLVHKAFIGGSPPYLADMMITRNTTRSTRSSHRVNLLVVPHHGVNKYSEKAFAVAGPRLWNELLTDELRGCSSLDTFKKKLKTLLFQKHY